MCSLNDTTKAELTFYIGDQNFAQNMSPSSNFSKVSGNSSRLEFLKGIFLFFFSRVIF